MWTTILRLLGIEPKSETRRRKPKRRAIPERKRGSCSGAPPRPAGSFPPDPLSTPGKTGWLRILEDTNKAIETLEKNGVKLRGYRAKVPPPAVAAMNDRIEKQLLRMGIPSHVHSVLAATLSSYVFAKEIEDKAAAAVVKAGIAGEEDEEFSMDQENRMWDIEGTIGLLTFCRAIGVEVSREEAEAVVRGNREWEQGA
ncbi:MAG: hypothetical protein MUC63_07095 [Planctomycetes bacterium]|nr:hypothetical protein [Planctomycetota bacterium]